MLEVVQLEGLQSNLHNVMTFLLLFKCRQIDAGEVESLFILLFGPGKELTWPDWADAKCNSLPLPRYRPGALYLGFHNVFHGHWSYLLLLTAQAYGSFSLLQPPNEVGESSIHGTFNEVKFCEHLQGSQGLLCPWPVLCHQCHWCSWGHMDTRSRPHSPEVLASIP